MSDQDLFKQLDAFIEEKFDANNSLDMDDLIEQFLKLQTPEDAKILRQKFKSFNLNHKQIADDIPEILGNIVSNFGELEAGQILDNYRIIKRLADGGMGEIYLAERADGQFNKMVALKILSKGLITDETINRFLRERQILASLRHANIAPLYDAGITSNNRPWFALEYIRGESIDDYCENNKLSIEQIVVLFLKVCEAISYAHANGVVHRDLKPANILVDTQEQLGKPMVLDFGIASHQQAQVMTSTGQIIGTPGYMSPEQTAGQTSRLDGRSDVFSLGVVLYQLISTKLPFRGKSITETNYKVLKEDPPSLSALKINPNLVAIVYKCLAKNPIQRYQSVKDLSNDLNAFLTGDSVVARNINTIQIIQSKIRKHPWRSFLISMLLLVMVFSTWLLVSQRIQSKKYTQSVQKYAFISKEIEQKIRQQHMLPHHKLQEQYGQINNSLGDMLSQIDKDDTITNGPLYATVGKAYMLMNQSRKSIAAFQKAQATGYIDPENEVQYGLALALYWEQHHPASQQITDENKRKIFIQQLNNDYLVPATIKLEKNLNNSRQSTYLKAYLAYLKKDFDQAIKLSTQAFSEDSGLYESLRLTGKALIDKGKIMAIAGQSEKAMVEYNKSAEILKKAINIGRSDLKTHLYNCELLKTNLHAHIIGSKDLIEDKIKQAESACLLALELLPDQLPVIISLSEVYSHWAAWLIDLNREFIPQTNLMLDYAQKAHELSPDNIDVLSLLVVGLIHVSSPSNKQLTDIEKIEKLKQARGHAEKSVEINPQDAYNWANIGDIEISVANRTYKQSDIREGIKSAINAYEKSDELLPSYAWRYMIANSYKLLQEYHMVHEEFFEAQEANNLAIDNYKQTIHKAKDFASGWKKLTASFIALITINEKLEQQNSLAIQEGLKALTKTCELYANRGNFPDDLFESIQFFTHKSLPINDNCPKNKADESR